ncbi:MAG TPA: anti-sigma factor, partial [Candidatus Acidoferrales bacterium]|nr:anti-sigma factor [Candidatus Acidoferrales bacterium]
MSDELHVSDSAGAYVLGALTPEEANEIETHAATCEQCREEIENLKHVVSVLPLACASVDPSPDLKSRILAAGRGDDQAGAILRRAVTGAEAREPKHDMWHRSLPSWAGVAGWMGLATACAIAGIFIGVAGERQRMIASLQVPVSAPMSKTLGRIAVNEAAARAPANAPAMDAYSVFPVGAEQLHSRVTVTHESKVWDLSVNQAGKRIPCKVIQPNNAPHAMIVADMPVAQHGMVYQVWLVRKGKMHRGPTVMPGEMMQTTIPMRVESGDVIAFSMEPPGG